MAAFHISTLSDEEQLKLLGENGDKDHMQVVWKFYSGIVEFSVRNSKFRRILDKTEGKTLLHLQCAYESQQSVTCTQLLKALQYKLQLVDKFLSVQDFTAIGYILNTSVVPTKLSIIRCNVNIEAINAVLLQLGEKGKSLIQGLHFEFLSFDRPFVIHSGQRFEFQVADCTDSECINKLLIKLTGLRKLSLRAGHKAALDLNSDFNMVRNYSANVIKTQDLSHTFDTISNSCAVRLTELRVENAFIQAESLIRILHSCCSLTNLALVTSVLYSWQVQALEDGLRFCTNLQELDISYVKRVPKFWPVVCSVAIGWKRLIFAGMACQLIVLLKLWPALSSVI